MKMKRMFFAIGLLACAAFCCGAVFLRRGTARVRPEPSWPFETNVAPVGLEPTFASVSEASAVCTGATAEPASVALDRLVSSLEAAGFAVRTPAADRVSAVLLEKGRRVAFASASPAEGGGAHWLVLVREVHR